MSCLAGPVAVEGPLVCPLGKARFHARPIISRPRLCAATPRQASCQSILLSPVLGRSVGQPVLASAQRQEVQPGKEPPSLLAPLPQWCHRLAGAFILAPLLFIGGSNKALAQPLQASNAQASSTTSYARPTPLFEVSSLDLRDSPQARVAATLATAMIGYGLVRSGTSGGLRASVAAGAAAGGGTAVALAGPPPPTVPSTSQARLERLDQLYREIEALKRRNDQLWKLAMEFLAEDNSLSVTEATVKAAQSMDLADPAEAAAAVLAEKAGSAPRALLNRSSVNPDVASPAGGLSSGRPSGGAMRGSTPDVTASAAASVASAVASASAKGVPVRPSGGASRLASPPGVGVAGQVDSRLPPARIPERPGGASARSGPLAAPPPDSSRVKPVGDSGAASPAGPNLAAWAGDVVRQAASGQQPPPPPPPLFLSTPPQEVLRPSIRPTRRITGTPPRQPRTFRVVSPPPLPLPPPARARPSFDVPADAPSPEEYLQQASGRTADGRVNPSFTSASVVSAPEDASPNSAVSPALAAQAAAAAPTAAALPTPPPLPVIPDPTVTQFEPAWWYNQLSWFTQRDGAGRGTSGTNPSFDASLALVDAEETVEVIPIRSPPQPEKKVVAPVVAGPAAAEAAPPAASLAATLVHVAETKGVDVGMGAAAAAASASWSTALTEGAAPNDYSPVERVAELLEVTTKTEEYSFPKYDPLRKLLSDMSAPSSAHKYDMLRGLLRSGREEREQQGRIGTQTHKYDLVYDLLQSLRTSGDPAAILAASDPKYDPVWSLLNMRAPAPGSLTKYDLVGSLLQAALAASPQPSRYDPLAALLHMQPVTGRFKYCLADVLLHGSWQQALDAGLVDLPSWDPMSVVVGPKGAARAPPRPPPSKGSGGRRPVNKYDMVGQALEAAAGLPEELSSGRWAAQPRDPLLMSATNIVTAATAAAASFSQARPPPSDHQPPSKYDMVGQALAAAAALPDDLSSGKWAAAQGGRELIVDTAIKAAQEAPWGIAKRVRNSGAAAWRAVTSVTSPVTNAVAKALGMPYEVAPGVVMKVERPRSGGAAPSPSASPTSSSDSSGSEDEGLPTVVFQFKDVEPSSSGSSGSSTTTTNTNRAKVKGRKSGAVTVTAKSWQQRGVKPPSRGVAVPGEGPSPAASEAGSQLPSPSTASQRLDRAVVPPSRHSSRRLAASMAPPPPAVSLPETDSQAAAAAQPATESLKLSELAVDLVVAMTVQSAHGLASPSLDDLVARFGSGFRDVAAQLNALRGDAVFMSPHPAVERVVRAAAANPGDATVMWSRLYDMAGAVQEAEAAMPGFLRDCAESYPLMHELLTTGDTAQAVSVLCTLSNLVPESA